MGWSKIEQVAS